MAWWNRDKKPLRAADRREVPTDVWELCKGCGATLYRERLAQNLNVCPDCGYHLPISADAYLSLLLDRDTFVEFDAELRSADPLGFTDLKPYLVRIAAAEAKGRGTAVLTGTGQLDGIDISIAVMDFEFVGGSMGSVVGEKIARVARTALQEKTPLVIVSASGGARMQEGVYSLMQMVKTSAVLARIHEAGLPFVSVITHPTTGGVTASYAMLGDTNLAEPGALIGFAGPRVIEETIKQELPKGFQRSEFLQEHGMVDRVVDRRELKQMISTILRHQYAGWKD